MKKVNSKLLIYIALIIALLVFGTFYLWIHADLKETVTYAKDELAVLDMLDHLDKLNTAITYI